MCCTANSWSSTATSGKSLHKCPESLPGEGNWDQLFIFRGFPVHQEDVFFSTLGHVSPTLNKCSAALVKLYK